VEIADAGSWNDAVGEVTGEAGGGIVDVAIQINTPYLGPGLLIQGDPPRQRSRTEGAEQRKKHSPAKTTQQDNTARNVSCRWGKGERNCNEGGLRVIFFAGGLRHGKGGKREEQSGRPSPSLIISRTAVIFY
jgi:hypothetical protein